MAVRRASRTAPALIAVLALLLPLLVAAVGIRRTPVVVTLSPQVGDVHAVARQLADRLGFEVRHVYQHALVGFAADVPAAAVELLRLDRRTVRVEPDVQHRVTAPSLPTGVDRIETDRLPAADLGGDDETVVGHDVAIIDTGLDADHQDLDVAGGRNFTSLLTSAWRDDNGHGTHVGGTVGARDDGVGVVGVAPGARLWAVKVCNALGLCLTSDVVAGIDWVAGQKASGAIDVAVANLSISTGDSSADCSRPNDAVHAAICGVVGEGVVVALAAGNSGAEKQAYPAALSVSAVADFDGRAGGAAPPTCRDDQDDTLADFSDHGDRIDLAAPGVCIRSTWPGGGYRTISGTSMATPHAAGAVALYLQANDRPPARDADGARRIEDAIVAAALPQGTGDHACSYDDERTGGPLLFVNAPAFGGDGSCEVADDDGVLLHAHDLDAASAPAGGPNWTRP